MKGQSSELPGLVGGGWASLQDKDPEQNPERRAMPPKEGSPEGRYKEAGGQRGRDEPGPATELKRYYNVAM